MNHQKISQLINLFHKLDDFDGRYAVMQLLEDGSLDFTKLAEMYTLTLRNERSAAQTKLHAALTLSQQSSKPISKLKTTQLGREQILVWLRSNVWRSAKIEDDWQEALIQYEPVPEEKMKMWGFPKDEV